MKFEDFDKEFKQEMKEKYGINPTVGLICLLDSCGCRIEIREIEGGIEKKKVTSWCKEKHMDDD